MGSFLRDNGQAIIKFLDVGPKSLRGISEGCKVENRCLVQGTYF